MRLLLALALSVVMTAGSRAAVVTVSDGTFAVADWEIAFSTFRSGPGGGALSGGNVQASQVTDDGTPPPARRVDITLPPAPAPTEYSSTFGVHLRTGFVYDPMTQGPIATFDYEEDAKVLAAPQLTGLAVRQGGELYFVQVQVFTSTAWTHLARQGIVRTNFEHLTSAGVVQGEYPDLTASGAPLEVGFLRANSTGAGRPSSFTNGALIDNWTVRLNPPCTTDGECDDGDPCGTEACVAGACRSTPVSCDDGDACTVDACAAGACVHTAISCDDAEACTADQCIGGSCTHTIAATEALVEAKIDELLQVVQGSCAGEPLIKKFGKKLVKKLKKARAKLAAADAATRATLVAKLHDQSEHLLQLADSLLAAAAANGLVGAQCAADLKALLDSIRACAAGL